MESLKRRGQTYLQPKTWIKTGVPSRALYPISAPPRFRYSFAQKLLMGGGSMLVMMIIPLWGLFSMPSWADKHQRLGKSNVVEEEEPPPPEAEEE
uniref:Uncharacterized protein n=1 Tax=Glossina morsitans morsitans TaxID=37546 RepID=A0A1B0FJF9_GLOMM